MFDNLRKSIVDRLLGTSNEAGEDELLDSETVQIQSDVHDGSRPHTKSHWWCAIDTIQVGCYCIWSRRTGSSVGEVEGERPSQHSHFRARTYERCQPPMATRSEVMEVLYPPSHLKIPQALDPEAPPPAYESRVRPIVHSYTPKVQPPCIFPRERRELKLLIPRTMPNTPQGLITSSMEPVLSYNLSDNSFLDFVVPSTTSPRSPVTRPRLPISDISLECPECDRDELPAYSRFDSLRPRGSDILGPYPHISIFSATPG